MTLLSEFKFLSNVGKVDINVSSQENLNQNLMSSYLKIISTFLIIIFIGQISNAQHNIITATMAGDLEAVRALVNKRVNVDLRDVDGATALIWAVSKGRIEIVKLLVRSGAKINARRTNGGQTALMFATVKGYTEIAEFLIISGAGIDSQDRRGQTALMWAAFNNRIEIVKLLKRFGATLDLQDEDDKTAFILVATAGHTETVRFLMDSGADVNIKDAYGKTALIWAVIMGRTETVKLLAESPRVNVNAQSKDGKTALIWATLHDNKEATIALVNAEADKSLSDENNMSALDYAVSHGYGQISEILLSNVKDKNYCLYAILSKTIH